MIATLVFNELIERLINIDLYFGRPTELVDILKDFLV